MKKVLQIFVGINLLLAMLVVQVHAQNVVQGKVISDDGESLPGVNVVVEGSSKGTVTDIEGNYTISLGENENVLIFNYIGFSTQRVTVEGRNVIDITMVPDVTALLEVVVVGYGTQKKRDVTGSIVSIGGDEIGEQPVPNVLSALQGKSSGLLVTNSGQAGASPTVRIRGVGSVNGVNPLYIVDGIFTDNTDFVNPADIESVEILKDPSSLAIFGVQGANGAIIITTKKAKKGQTNINFSTYAGFQTVNERIGVTNAEQFKMLYNEELANLGSAPFDFSQYDGIDTDWQEKILRTGFITNNTLSVRSGSENNQVTLSFSYMNQEGVQKYDEYTRYTMRLRDELKLGKHFTVGADINGYRWKRNPTSVGITNALWASPVFDVRNEYGDWMASPTFQRAQVGNPVATTEINNEKNLNDGYRLVASAWGEVSFLKDFNFKSTFYTDLAFSEQRQYFPIFQVGSDQDGSVAQFRDRTAVLQEVSKSNTWQQDHILTYTKNINQDHDVSVTAGIISRYVSGGFSLGGQRTSEDPVFIPDDERFWYLSIEPARTSQQIFTSAPEEATYLSFLGRVNYSFRNKYLFNATFRRDGTSKFSPENRWGNFGSVGAGWIITEEDFLNDIAFLDFLKVKVSWGALGNDKIGNYRFYPSLQNSNAGVFGENVLPGVSPSYIANPDLKWETVVGYDIGFEAELMNNRLSLDFSYYNRESKDLLVSTDVSSITGNSQFLTNLGSIVNKGIELSPLWSDQLTDAITYRIGGYYTTINNEVTSIGDDLTFSIINGNSRTVVGEPVGHFYGYEMVGIFQTAEEITASAQPSARPGDIIFRDINDDGAITTADRTNIGSYIPDITYALNFGISFMNFDLDIETQGVAGNSIYRERSRSRFAVLNYEEERLGRWTGPGTTNTEPILDSTRPGNYEHSDYFIDKGDYFRIRTIALGYNFDAALVKQIGLTSAKIYVNAQNPITWHQARNYSPEVSGGSAIRAGIDDGVYPVPATYTLGININF